VTAVLVPVPGPGPAAAQPPATDFRVFRSGTQGLRLAPARAAATGLPMFESLSLSPKPSPGRGRGRAGPPSESLALSLRLSRLPREWPGPGMAPVARNASGGGHRRLP
jgi:hypothetical protein